MSRSRSSISSCARAPRRSIRPPISRHPAPSFSLLERLAELAGEIQDKLPGDAARASAARHRPFVRRCAKLLVRHLQPEATGIAFDDREIGVLVAVVEAEP